MKQNRTVGVSNVYCINCDAKKPCSIKMKRLKMTVNGKTFGYDELAAYCPDCGEEVYAPIVNDLNVIIRKETRIKITKALFPKL